MGDRISTALEVAGLLMLSLGAGLVALWLGLMVGGLSLVLVGLAAERR